MLIPSSAVERDNVIEWHGRQYRTVIVTDTHVVAFSESKAMLSFHKRQVKEVKIIPQMELAHV